MFRQQQIILESVPALRDLLSRYTWQGEPAHWLALAEESAQRFRVTLPLVGAFSSGKSSILNALIGESLFSVNIDPETAVPAVGNGLRARSGLRLGRPFLRWRHLRLRLRPEQRRPCSSRA